MSIPHNDIQVKTIPDEYHIKFAGKMPNGEQVFVTADLSYDPQTKKTTDYIVEYIWDSSGILINSIVTEIGVRGEYDNSDAARTHDNIESKYSDLKLSEIIVKPCRFEFNGIEFGFIPRTDDDFTVVEVMPGNCLCFTEPFDGEYDT